MECSNSEVRIVPLPLGKGVLTDLLRLGAQRLLAEAEVAEWLDRRQECRDAAGRRQVVRNGHRPERTIMTGIGPVMVEQPRVCDHRPAGEREKFTSAILPPNQRKSKSIEELIPCLYLKGVSIGYFSEASAALLGPDAKGLSAARHWHALNGADRLNEVIKGTVSIDGIKKEDAA